jgi:hypothetical protein
MKRTLKIMDVIDFEKRYFITITAYCGEVMRREIDGEWN